MSLKNKGKIIYWLNLIIIIMIIFWTKKQKNTRDFQKKISIQNLPKIA